MLKFNILTLFPEVFPGILQHGLLGKALSKNHFEINTINIRDYSDLSANSVDDKPFSGGAGMVLRPDIISKSIEANFNKNELVYFMIFRFAGGGGIPFGIQNVLPIVFDLKVKNYF